MDETKKLKLSAKMGLFMGRIVGLLGISVLSLLLVQLILIVFISTLDTWKAVAFIAQFPATFYIWIRWKQ